MVARIITLVAALLVAAVGATLVILYARQADDRAREQYVFLDVVVAADEVPAGTPFDQAALSDALFGVQEFAQRDLEGTEGLRALGVITEEELGELGTAGQFVQTPLRTGEFLLRSNLGPAVETEDDLGLGGETLTNAVTITLGEDARGTQYLRPGFPVAVYVTYSPSVPSAGNPDNRSWTCVALGRMEVLAVGSRTVTPEVESTPGAQSQPSGSGQLVTLSVDQQSASKIVYWQAREGAQLHFVLLPKDSEGFAEGIGTCRLEETAFRNVPGIPDAPP